MGRDENKRFKLAESSTAGACSAGLEELHELPAWGVGATDAVDSILARQKRPLREARCRWVKKGKRVEGCLRLRDLEVAKGLGEKKP